MGDVLNEKPTVRLVATAGADDGRGHVGRALALAEALHEAGARIELELVRGALAPPEAARAAATGLELVVAGTAAKPGAPVVVDLPVLEPTAGRFDPRALAVFDDRDVFGGHWEMPELLGCVLQESMACCWLLSRTSCDLLVVLMQDIETNGFHKSLETSRACNLRILPGKAIGV